MLKNEKTTLLGYVLTLSAAICWGFSGACGEFLFQHRAISPEWVTMLRMVVTGSVMLPLLFVLKGKKVVFQPFQNKKESVHLFLFALIGLASCQYTYLMVIKFSNAGTGTMLQYMGPIFVMLIMCFLEKRLPKKMEIISLIMVLVGVFFVAMHGDLTNLHLTPTVLIFGFLAAITLAIYTILPIALIKNYGSTLITAWAMLIGGITIAFFYHPSFGQEAILDIGTVLGLFGLIFIGTLFSYTVFLYGVSLLGPVKASMIACIEPISAAIISKLWFGTQFVFYDYIGFMLIILAVICVSLNSKEN